jgi:hypothetical protein
LSPRALFRGLRILHCVAAVGIVLFWIGFYTEVGFPRAVLEKKIPHFDAYYAFEKAFTVPDLVTATAMAIAAPRLLRDPTHRASRALLLAASGGLVFLGLLDFMYDFRNGLYGLDVRFTLELLLVPLVGLLGVGTIAFLAKSAD